MKNIKRILCLGAVLAMVLSMALLTSCKEKPFIVPNDKYIEFPIEKNVKFTWWYDYDDTYYTGDFATLEEHPFVKELQAKSNVSLEFVRPSQAGKGAEELNTHIASGDMCDLVTHNWYTPSYEGNSIDAVVDNEIYQLLNKPGNDFVAMQMPNLNALREEYSVIDKVIVTGQNNILWIPRVNAMETYMTPTLTGGLVVRKDLLDEVQFVSEDGVSKYPITIRDWERMLEAFQLAGVENPLATFMGFGWCTFSGDVFLSSWNVKVETYRDPTTGNVAYGAMSDGFFEYLKLINSWIQKGYLADLNLTKENKLAQNYVGAWYGSADEVANLAKESNNPNFELIGVPDPVQNVGDKIVMRDSYRPVGCKALDSVFVAYECENGPLACRLLDEFFTKESYDRTSYGIKDVDYTKDADGNVTFTEKVTGNPDGIRYGIYQNAFMESFWRDENVLVKYVYDQHTLDAIAQWSKSSCEYSFIDRLCLSYTEEELAALDMVGDTYGAVGLASRTIAKGEGVGLEQWDEYVAGVREVGIEEYVEVMQSAWDRFLAN